jgi:hypothetical protein
MNRQTLVVIATALIAGPVAVQASPVTYYITGTVDDTTGPVPEGTGVTGTFTVDLDNANPSQGTPGVAGTYLSNTSESDYLVTADLQAGTASYITPMGTGTNGSRINYTTSMLLQDSSQMTLAFECGGVDCPPYTTAGQPDEAGSGSFGYFVSGGNEVDFTISTLTPVPLPPSLWLMLGGLGGIGLLLRKQVELQPTINHA